MNMQHPSKWKDPNLDKAEAQDEVLGWFSCNSFLAGGGFHHVERETQIQELLEDVGQSPSSRADHRSSRWSCFPFFMRKFLREMCFL